MALSWALTMLVLLATSSTEPERGEEEESQFDIGGCLLLIGSVSCRVVYTATLILLSVTRQLQIFSSLYVLGCTRGQFFLYHIAHGTLLTPKT